MNDNLKFWIATLSSVVLFSLGYSFATTTVFYMFFMSAGTVALLITVYFLSKQKLKGLLTFIRYLLYKGHR